MKYWEIIADNLSKAGWSWGCVARAQNKARQIAAMMVKTSSVTSSDVSTHLRPG
jgi:hypothetical protein